MITVVSRALVAASRHGSTRHTSCPHRSLAAALFAVAAIGVQQGAEIDLLAYFVASRFGMDRYGTIYGWVQVAGWMGTLCGVLLFGKIHDWTGDYSLFQAGAVFHRLLLRDGRSA